MQDVSFRAEITSHSGTGLRYVVRSQKGLPVVCGWLWKLVRLPNDW